MLAQLIALGVFDGAATPEPEAGTGEIIATPERTVAAVLPQPVTVIGNAIPLGAYVWPQAYDPGDHAPFAFGFAALLDEGERIADIASIRMSPAAAALGVMVDEAPTYAPIIDADGGQTVQVWFTVDPALQEAASFDASGVRLPVSFRVVTDSTPPKRFERTGVLVVRQQ